MNILERDRSGEPVSPLEPEYAIIRVILKETSRILFALNSSFHDDAEIRRLFSTLTGVEVDETFILRPPFYADFGRNIRVGKNVFINHNCTFMDRGGITLEDDVLIAPKVNLVTLNHLIHPSERRTTVCAPITIKRNAWIGLGATIMPGVTIGENAIVAASALVTRDVPPNTVVAGIPATVTRHIDDSAITKSFTHSKGAV
ncbi:MAG: sugar O-acetyltransferase [Planctomycetes bacterium]|nr:sugar O-acetyltransferase [Planctomycetota bacterium]